MFITKEQFEKSKLFQENNVVNIPNAVNGGYECYCTIPVDDGIAIVLQLNEPDEEITIFRASAEGELTREQKTKIFQFACDFIYGNGAHYDTERFAEFVRLFADRLDAGQIQNTFLLAGFNLGFLENEVGGMKGVECRTAKAEPWNAALQ